MMCPTHALVAQLDRVQVSEAWGRGFDPRRARQIQVSLSFNSYQIHWYYYYNNLLLVYKFSKHLISYHNLYGIFCNTN